MKIRKFKVSIRKRSCATKTFAVEATDCETAEKAAMEYAQTLQFTSDYRDYDVYCPECDRHFVEVHDMIYGGAIDDQGNEVESDYEDGEEF